MKKFLLVFFFGFILFLLYILTKIPSEQWGSILVLIVLMAAPIGYFVFNYTREKKDNLEKDTEYMKQIIKERMKKGDFD